MSHDRPTPAERAAAAAHDPRTCADCRRLSSIDVGGDQAFTEDEVEIMRLRHQLEVVTALKDELAVHKETGGPSRELVMVTLAHAVRAAREIKRDWEDLKRYVDETIAAAGPDRRAGEHLADSFKRVRAERDGVVALATANKRDLEVRQAGFARLLDAIGAQLGVTGLELAEAPHAANRTLKHAEERERAACAQVANACLNDPAVVAACGVGEKLEGYRDACADIESAIRARGAA